MLGFGRAWAVPWLLFAAQQTFASTVSGAFGLAFDTPLAAQQLHASSSSPARTTLFHARDTTRQLFSSGDWRAFVATSLPRRLQAKSMEFWVQATPLGLPVWILANQSSDNCPGDLAWLQGVLNKKYRLDDLRIEEIEGSLAQPFNQRLEFDLKGVSVAAGCTNADDNSPAVLQIEYLATSEQPVLLDQQHLATRRQQQAEEALSKASTQIGKLRGRAVAATIASGNKFQIDQIFGIVLADPVKAPGNFTPDSFVPYPLQGVAPPFLGQTAKVQLSPTGHLIRFEVNLTDDTKQSSVPQLQQSLQSQFGTPQKATQRHVIFHVGQDYLVLQRKRQQLHIALIVGAEEQAMKARLKLAQEAIWQSENAGI